MSGRRGQTGSELTCVGKCDQVLGDETLEPIVCVRQRLPQNGLQPSEDGHGVQGVEGETAGKGQEVAGGVDSAGGRVGHHVPIHGTVQCGCNIPIRSRKSLTFPETTFC